MRGWERLFANVPTHVGWTVSVDDMTQMMIMLKLMMMIDHAITVEVKHLDLTSVFFVRNPTQVGWTVSVGDMTQMMIMLQLMMKVYRN